jgi:transcriptional regulator with XRE-family HTH domain
MADDNALGAFLKDRRARLDPAAFGIPLSRRRTPGLRREEVAQRAHVSATWYTWLEQGRGGSASADVLDRIARALMLTEAEREHLFLLGLGRPPDTRFRAVESISPRLQGVLDALPHSAAYIKTPMWDIIAWNRAATKVLTDYGDLPPERRNILRLMFGGSHVRARQADWRGIARFVVATFRADVVRAGAVAEVQGLVDELCAMSEEFADLWAENNVQSGFGDHPKRINHPVAGWLALDYCAFAVDGRPDLQLVVYNPATPEDVAKVKALLEA